MYKTLSQLKYYLIRLVLRFLPSELLEKIACLQAVLVARLIVKKVPAYKEFLKEHAISLEKMRTLVDFRALPIMDKKNYFFKYGIEKTLLGKSLSDGYNWEQSSNYDTETGFTFWPRFFEDEEMCLTNFDFLLRHYYNCDKKKTLIVVTFVLGMWAAGERISKFAKQLASEKGLKISVASIGPIRMLITDFIKKIGKSYDQIILVGNPYFLRRAIEHGEEEGVDWRSLNTNLLTAADGFSENWREFMLQKIANEKEPKSKKIVSVFGLTETSGSFAIETTLTNLIKKLSKQDAKLKKAFFGDEETLPMCFQYNPLNNFLETDNGELIITKLTKQPLLRFNTHDLGSICSFEKAMKTLKELGYDAEQLLKSEGENGAFPLPLVFIYGRNRNGLKVQGVTFTVEELREFLSHPELIKSNTGNFRVETIKENGMERLKLTIELMDGIKPLIELSKKYREIFCSSDFKAILAFLKFFDGTIEEIAPIINLVEKGQAPFSQEEKPKYHYLEKN